MVWGQNQGARQRPPTPPQGWRLHGQQWSGGLGSRGKALFLRDKHSEGEKEPEEDTEQDQVERVEGQC